MASSFGGTVKLTGESEYIKALKNINSNLRVVSSELKLASTEFVNNGSKLSDLKAKNDALNKKLQEEQNIVKTCTNAIKDFTLQQTENQKTIDKIKSSLNNEQQTLEKLKNSTTATSSEIAKQEKVVADLSNELEKAKNSYDANNKKIDDYKIKMNNAKSECSDLSKKIQDNNSILKKSESSFNDNTKSIKNFAKEEENAGKSAITLGDLIKGNLISEGIISGIKGLVNTLKSVGTAILDVGKQALTSYADYEQLVGGVETLFKDNASVVENYANNAYKNAGLSANEYMETVTSFSASLLQSLGNDTSKSADYADRAIVDMADNANKMGTSMDMIQNAYQGFAKQNYTMLDNLKLGYGGTKSEMERLISDANKVKEANGEMANLSISSFADVTEAIHIIQTEMGITGTTAKEANETISGSISSTKSAWENLLTGLANGNADLGGLMKNLVDGISTTAENIMPVVEQVANSIVEMLPEVLTNITKNLPKFLESGSKILTNLINGITRNMPLIMNSVIQIITAFANTILQNLPTILEAGIQMIISLVEGIAQQAPTLIPQIMDTLITMVETFLDNIDLIVDAGIQLIMGLSQGLMDAIPRLVDKIPEIIDKLVMAITDNLPKILAMGIEIQVKLIAGIIQAIPKFWEATPKVIGSLVNGLLNFCHKLVEAGGTLLGKLVEGLKNGLNSIKDVGKNLVEGLWNGINDAKDWVLDKIKSFGDSILDGIKEIFGIASPSKVFRDEIGVNLAKGIGVGFQKEMKDVNNTIQDALPTDIDLATNVNVSKTGSILSSNDSNVPNYNQQPPKVENNTYNFYSPKDSPSEYARQIRNKKQYLELVGAT